MKFSANISTLFREAPFLERFSLAAKAGFNAVEFWWPAGEDLGAVEAAIRASGVKVVLFNFDAGDMPGGDRGLLSDPARESAFRENVPVALEFAGRVGCRQLNALVGVAVTGMSRSAQLKLAATNIRWAARQAAASDAHILIEAVNTFENGAYLLSRTDEAVSLIQGIDEPNVGLQYDVYHMQRMEGNLAATIRRHKDLIAHVQVADSPGRGEPGTGEINFAYLFRVLEEVGYGGHVGLEYVPTTATTEQSFGWMVDSMESPGGSPG